MNNNRKSLLRDERGATLVIVTVIMLVLTLAATGVAVVVMNTTSLVTNNRSTVESRAAADAGISAAVAEAHRGIDFCDPDYNPTSSNPDYSVTVECGSGEVIFTSIGEGKNGASTTSRAVYSLESSGGGPSSEVNFHVTGQYNNVTINPDPNRNGTAQYFSSGSGTYTCNGATIPGDLFVKGNFAISGACNITGSLWVGGNANFNGSTLTVGKDLTVVGNVVASSSSGVTVSGVTHVGGNMNFNGGTPATFKGSVYVRGTGTSYFNGSMGEQNKPLVEVFVAGEIQFIWTGDSRVIYANVAGKHNVTVYGRTIAGSVTLPSARTYNQNNATVQGGIIRNNSVTLPPMPPTPTFPSWPDYTYSASHWPGYTVRNLSALGMCSSFGWRSASGFSDLEAATSPVILDARGCGSSFGLTPWNVNDPVTLRTDVVILANGFNLGGLGLKAAAGKSPKVWIVTEATSHNGDPVCTSAKSAGITVNGVNVQSPVTVMLYTPCKIESSGGGTIRGTVYSGSFNSGGSLTLNGAQISLPTWSGSGSSGSGSNGGTLGGFISQRDY